uniref:Uncharacterized protein n=1 Tax=Micrurus corallinus TaxID=54390 RepID=A0A2D4FNE2_MICCO
MDLKGSRRNTASATFRPWESPPGRIQTTACLPRTSRSRWKPIRDKKKKYIKEGKQGVRLLLAVAIWKSPQDFPRFVQIKCITTHVLHRTTFRFKIKLHDYGGKKESPFAHSGLLILFCLFVCFPLKKEKRKKKKQLKLWNLKV